MMMMMRSLCCVLVVGVSHAFVVPSAGSATTTRLSAMVGSTAPMGSFDPLGLMKGKSEAESNRLRECELKHGRVAMAAVLGLIVEPVVHPLASSCHVTAVTDPFRAGLDLNDAGKLQIIGFCAGVEFLAFKMKTGDKYQPGDVLGAAYLVEDDQSVEWITYQEKELNNGR